MCTVWEKSLCFTCQILNLTAKDLKALLTAQHETTTKWELLGIALGFDPEDLKIIEQTATLISQGPVAYFKEMLYQWLKWGPPSHKHSPFHTSVKP